MTKCIFMLVFTVLIYCGVHCLPPIVTLGYQGATRTPITMMRLVTKNLPKLTDCPPERAPTTRSYSGWEECANRCPEYCQSLSNCNATCILENRCVCGASTYCLINREKLNPDNSYGQDCYSLDELTYPKPN
nr:venom peptide [Acharia stimulea]